MSDRTIVYLVAGLIALGLLVGQPEGGQREQPAWVSEKRSRQTPPPPTEDDHLRGRIADDLRDGLPFSDVRRGAMVTPDGNWRMGNGQLAQAMAQLDEVDRAQTYSWQTPGRKIFAFSAQSTGQRYYFASGYLTGWQPFAVNQLWKPWYAVAHRMRYAFDHELFFGRPDVWQTAYQSWLHQLGDCEDHSLLLADWLINLGEDARVVLGDYRGEGHAWVVVIRDDHTYLLEATQKFGGRALREYPLASTLRGYHPRAMFNRDILWVNEGSSLTTQYSDERWRKAGGFQAAL